MTAGAAGPLERTTGVPVSVARRPRAVLPLVMLAVVVFIWSSNNIASKLSLRDMTPELLFLFRSTAAVLLFHLPVFLLLLRSGQRLTTGEWKRLGSMGFLGPAASTFFFTIAISLVPATYAGLMLMTGPLWTALLERVFQGHRITRARGLGMAIAFLAAGILATGGELEAPDTVALIGSLLLIGAQTTWGGYTIICKPILARRQPILALAGANVCAVPFIWVAGLVLGAWQQVPTIAAWPLATWAGMAYLTIFAGGLSQLMYIYALRDVTPSQASSFTYLMPVFTAGLAALILGEQVTALTLGCGVLIVLGLWLVNRAR